MAAKEELFAGVFRLPIARTLSLFLHSKVFIIDSLTVCLVHFLIYFVIFFISISFNSLRTDQQEVWMRRGLMQTRRLSPSEMTSFIVFMMVFFFSSHFSVFFHIFRLFKHMEWNGMMELRSGLL